MEELGLQDDQLEKLKQFTEFTNIEDYHVAMATLESLNWNVEQAIEAHLMQDADEHDDPEIIEPQNRPPVLESSENNRTERILRGRRRIRNDDDDDMDIQIDHDEPSENNSNMLRRSNRNRNGSSYNSSAGPSRSNGRNIMIDSDAEMSYNDYDDDDDMYRSINNDVTTSNSNGVPLIPDGFTDVSEALRNFVSVFEKRFCSTAQSSAFMPQFYTESLESALKESFEKDDCSLRRPLAIYIHHDKGIAANIFATQVLCTEAISSLLRHQYVLWPWDITKETNYTLLMHWLTNLNINEVRNTVSRLSVAYNSSFPLIAIVIREKSSYKLVSVCKGTDMVDTVLGELMRGVDEYSSIRLREAQEKRDREERDAIRRQQEQEYEESLAADRARLEAMQKEIADQKAEEERKMKEKEEEEMRRLKIASLLPSEPKPTDQGIIHVKFRLPEGAQEMRRFRLKEKVQVLVNYLSSKGFAPEGFKYFNSDFPKKEITKTFDLTKTFEEVKWPAREQVFVEEI